jgi:hypothetical protein
MKISTFCQTILYLLVVTLLVFGIVFYPYFALLFGETVLVLGFFAAVFVGALGFFD